MEHNIAFYIYIKESNTFKCVFSTHTQSRKNMSLVPQAQVLVWMWFLKICGKFCLNTLSNRSNSKYIFLLSKTMDLLSAKFCIYAIDKGCVKQSVFSAAQGVPATKDRIGLRRHLLTKQPVYKAILEATQQRMLCYVCLDHQS